jgi:hypothetical protein
LIGNGGYYPSGLMRSGLDVGERSLENTICTIR